MIHKRHKIQFPRLESHKLGQDEVYFYLLNSDPKNKKKIRFHDYDEIYKIPGLYEQVFYDRLQCNSPKVVTEILESAVTQANENFSELRVLDLGAGNGIMGEELNNYGISRCIGVDIIKEAELAVERDRPQVYDAYYVSDFCNLSDEDREEFKSWNLNCFTTVAALGFGDIPPTAFIESFNLIQPTGWVAFNIKESFLDRRDDSGFSKLIRELIFSEYLHLSHLERYRHRLSVEGEPLYYYAIAGKKTADIPPDYFECLEGI